MKVLQVAKFYHPFIGGVEKVVQEIAEGLNNTIDMRVLVCRILGFGKEAIVNGVRVAYASCVGVFLSMPISLSLPFLLRRMSSGCDILHFHGPFPLGELAFLLVRPRARTIVWWHMDVIRQKRMRALYRPVLLRFLRRVDRIIVATPQHIDSSPVLPAFRDKCEVIPYGIEIERFRMSPAAREASDRVRERHGARIVLFVGRLVYYKGVTHLVRAMQQIDAKLLLVGDGPLKEDLRRAAADLGVADKVCLLGGLSDDEITAHYHACDVFVLPSVANTEGFGLVQLEAMACGKPVVNTNLPTGVPYVSVDGETGITVPPGDSLAIAAAVNRLLGDPDLRRRLGENGRRRVENGFTRQRMVEKVLDLYRRLERPNA